MVNLKTVDDISWSVMVNLKTSDDISWSVMVNVLTAGNISLTDSKPWTNAKFFMYTRIFW